MAQLVNFLKQKMEQEGITAYALEKRAGLKPSAVNNIIYGKSKNPSITVLKAISRALNCTVADLIGEEPDHQIDSGESTLHSSGDFTNHELYIISLLTFSSILKKRQIRLSKEKIINCVDEIYLFSVKKDFKNTVDDHFVEWILDKITNNPKKGNK